MTNRHQVRYLAIAVLVATCSGLSAKEIDFLRDVKPIFVARCYRCHSSLAQESNLRLDSAAAILKGGEQGTVIIPGKSAESRLLAAVMRT